MSAQLIITAILAMFPHMSGNNRACIIAQRDTIAQHLLVAHQTYPELPMVLMAAVAFAETHLGCDAGEGGNWGAPISPARRHVAGTPLQAARALATGIARCGSFDGAVMRFRVGLCQPRRQSSDPVVRRRAEHYLLVVNGLVSRIRQFQETALLGAECDGDGAREMDLTPQRRAGLPPQPAVEADLRRFAQRELPVQPRR